MPDVTLFLLFALLGSMWALQLLLTWWQARSFLRAMRRLRTQGRTAVGLGGRRYRGGRAFVALAASAQDTVVDARVLRGMTVGARPRPLPVLTALPLELLAGEGEIAGLRRNVRDAVRGAAAALLAPAQTAPDEPAPDPVLAGTARGAPEDAATNQPT